MHNHYAQNDWNLFCRNLKNMSIELFRKMYNCYMYNVHTFGENPNGTPKIAK